MNKEEDPQVANETMEMGEKEVYERIKADMDRLPDDKQKELWYHIQGILASKTLAHKHAAEAENHLAGTSWLLSTPGIMTLANATVRPHVGVHLPIMEKIVDEACKKHEEMAAKKESGVL